MATRLYSSRQGTALTPAFSTGWDDASGGVRVELTNEPDGVSSALGPTMSSTGVNPSDILAAQFISAPLAAQTISGTLKGQMLAREQAAGGANARAQLIARIYAQNGLFRSTLLGFDGSALSSEFNADATIYENRKFPLAAVSPRTVTTQAVLDGDRIVIEVGARMHTTGVETARMKYGSPNIGGPDLAENETATAENNAWFEFSANLVFLVQPTAVISQPATAIAPSKINQKLNPAVISQAAAVIAPSQLGQRVVPALVQRLAAPVAPTFLQAQFITPAVIAQPGSAVAPAGVVPVQSISLPLIAQPGSVVSPVLTQRVAATLIAQLLSPLAPTMQQAQVIMPGLTTRLLSTISPLQIAQRIRPDTLEYLAEAFGPALRGIASTPQGRGMLLRGVGGSRTGAVLSFVLGAAARAYVMPFDVDADGVSRGIELPFWLDGPARAPIALPFDIQGPLVVTTALPFDILDGTVGLDEFDQIIAPLLGWYDPTDEGG